MNLFGYELTLRKTHKKKIKGFSAKRWSASEQRTLLKFRNEGKSNEEIAKLLHRTVPAIYSKMWKIRNIPTKRNRKGD